MSKCISAKGEYSEHAPGEEEEFVCGRCYVVDEEAMRAEIERLRADRPSVTDNARADHTITYRHDRDTVTAVIRCHAAADADCRLHCDHPDGYCDEWHIERDKGGPFHTVEAEDDTTGEYREERHPLVPASSCNAVEWIGNWDVHEAGPYETFDIATIPIEPVWNGDGYTWKRAAGRAETTTATVEHAARLLQRYAARESVVIFDGAAQEIAKALADAGLLARPTPTRDHGGGQA